MKAALKHGIQEVLRRFNLRIVDRAYFDHLVRSHIAEDDLCRIAALPGEHTRELVRALPDSKSQLRQDLFVLAQLGFKRNGYFVEFGAADGIEGSNTHLLERSFGWTGILAEPARGWHAALARNRACRIETRCVWSATGQTLKFNEVEEGAFSTIDGFGTGELNREKREKATTYEVETVSLDDLLRIHGAPAEIDYLSIDTEGSEFEILSHFDFDRHRFAVITCEHAFTPARERLHALLSSKGYVRTLEAISSFDDWYVSAAPAREQAAAGPSGAGSGE